MPFVQGPKEILLFERHHHVGVVQAHFGCARTDIDKQRGKLRHNIVAFALAEFLGEVAVPEPTSNAEAKFVGEEEVQTFAAFAGIAVLEALVELVDHLSAACRMHRIDGNRFEHSTHGDDAPGARGRLPSQHTVAYITA